MPNPNSSIFKLKNFAVKKCPASWTNIKSDSPTTTIIMDKNINLKTKAKSAHHKTQNHYHDHHPKYYIFNGFIHPVRDGASLDDRSLDVLTAIDFLNPR